MVYMYQSYFPLYSFVPQFWFRDIFHHPCLSDVKYLMRLDTDSYIANDWPDIFEAMRDREAVYFANEEMVDTKAFLPGMSMSITRKCSSSHWPSLTCVSICAYHILYSCWFERHRDLKSSGGGLPYSNQYIPSKSFLMGTSLYAGGAGGHWLSPSLQQPWNNGYGLLPSTWDPWFYWGRPWDPRNLQVPVGGCTLEIPYISPIRRAPTNLVEVERFQWYGVLPHWILQSAYNSGNSMRYRDTM